MAANLEQNQPSDDVLCSNEELLPKKGGAKSAIWTYFGFQKPDEDGDEIDYDIAVCRVRSCQKKMKASGGNTSNLFRHLSYQHPALFHLAKGKQKLGTPTMNTTLPQASTTAGPSKSTISGPSAGQQALRDFVPYDRNSKRWKQLTSSVTWCIAKDILPIYSVEKEGFKKMLKTFDSKYVLPSRAHFSKTALPSLYNDIKGDILEELKDCKEFALTADMWSSRTTEPFMGVTVHYICSSWTLKSHCLQTLFFPEVHTGENIAEHLLQTLEDWGLATSNLSCITTDNGANIVKAAKDLNWSRLSCFGHNLHLAVNNALKGEDRVTRATVLCKNIVSAFGNSFKRRKQLGVHQQGENLPQHGLISECDTRWGSKQKMIARVLEQEKAISLTLAADRKVSHLIPTWQNITVLKSINEAIEPVSEFTDMLSGEKYVSVSAVVPTLRLFHTIDFWGEKETDTELTAQLKKKALTYMEKKYEDDNVKMMLNKCTLLDPRYKGEYTEPEYLIRVRQELVREIVSLQPDQQTAGPDVADQESSEPPKKKLALGDLFAKAKNVPATSRDDHSTTSTEDKAKHELDAYLNMPVLPFTENSLDWWRDHCRIYPSLAKLARKYLCITATSSPSERMFSKAGSVVSPKRASLKPEKVNMLTFLATNL